ncbi:MAG: ABC transporter ATP-binding protein, partial [SAR324 cluster bacterium]|nr:ABC transporter ATP-binding protein [SAR324 cluster bacterium]
MPEGIIKAVDGVSFRIAPGSTVALVGESGSGKTVISQALMNILPNTAHITAGEIIYRDPDSPEEPIDITKLAPDGRSMRSLRGRRISIIFQEPMSALSPLHTIEDQIGELARLHLRKRGAEARELVDETLRLVGFPRAPGARRTYPHELSGGLRQRAMIAMALVCRPALLIADEPTTALDVTIQAQILNLIRDLQRELGMAILLITHDLGVVANVAEEVVVIYRGRLMESGAIDELFQRPEHPYLRALFTAVPRFGMPAEERLASFREVKVREHPLPSLNRSPAEAVTRGAPLLEVRNITKHFPLRKAGLFSRGAEARLTAVNAVSFALTCGECLGLVGESGSGKSTTCRIILRALTPDGGEVLFHGGQHAVDLLKLSNSELLGYRRRIQYIFQDPFHSLNPRMTIKDIIGEPLLIHQIGDRSERLERVKTLIELVGLERRHMNRYPHSFSGGQRQRIGIARALALQPHLLICDEPVSALDVLVQAQILNLLKDLQTQLQLTLLFVSHNLAVVNYIADRIAVMCAGHLVELAPRDELFGNPRHPYTHALLKAIPEPDVTHKLDFSTV